MSSPRKALRDLSLRLYVVFPNETAKLQARKTLRLNHTEDASVSASSVSKQFAHFVIFSGILKGSVQPVVGCFLVTKRLETMQEANQSASG